MTSLTLQFLTCAWANPHDMFYTYKYGYLQNSCAFRTPISKLFKKSEAGTSLSSFAMAYYYGHPMQPTMVYGIPCVPLYASATRNYYLHPPAPQKYYAHSPAPPTSPNRKALQEVPLVKWRKVEQGEVVEETKVVFADVVWDPTLRNYVCKRITVSTSRAPLSKLTSAQCSHQNMQRTCGSKSKSRAWSQGQSCIQLQSTRSGMQTVRGL